MSDQAVPFHRPGIGQEEIDEVTDTLRSGWLTTGPKTALFEREFQAYTGAGHALAVNSCTAGLHLALAALGVGPGDEVITTPLTFCATVNTILHVGATPVLADIGADGNLDPEMVEQRITRRTRAIMPVHLGGLPCDMDALWSLARRHNLFVVDDAAHAVGSHYRGSPIGSGSDAVAFSFHATKSMTTGEGGMVTTPHAFLADSMRKLCLHGVSKDAWGRRADARNWYYQVESAGFKCNLSDIQSAIGIHQLRKLEKAISIRTAYAHLYRQEFAGIDELETPPECDYGRHSWHLYGLRLNLDTLDITRDEFIEALRVKNIGASVHFIPIPMHPFFESHAHRAENHCPRAIALYSRLVSLPLYQTMTEEQVGYVAASVKQIVAAGRKRKSVAMSAAS